MAKLIDIGSIASHFESLSDPRHTRNRKHLLIDIVVIAVAAIVCNCDGPTAIHRYYIASRYLSGKRFAEAVRGHWGIESMHWTLDVTFREDDSRTRERTLANNLSWLRRFAVTLLKRHPAKDSIRGKMLRCGYSTNFLTEVLTLKGL